MRVEGLPLLHVNLCTYADLAGAGRSIVDFIEFAIDLATGADIPLRIRVERQAWRHRPETGRRLTGQAWAKSREVILDGGYTGVVLFNDSASPSQGMPRFLLDIQASDVYSDILTRIRDPAARERVLQAARPTPRFINLAVAVGDGGIDLDRGQLRTIVQAVESTFQQVHGACGLMTADAGSIIGDRTQYELSRRVYWASTPEIFTTRLRGAFWGNLLSPRHVAILGGLNRVAQEAPCSVVEPLTFDEPASAESMGAYLQLSEHPEDVSAAQMEALSRYLAPLLP